MKHKGQALLLVLLVVAIVLGLGLSLMSQSTTDIRLSQQEQEAARAFSAAEAGIEDALRQITTIVGAGSQQLTIDSIPVNYSVSGQDFLEAKFLENESIQVILNGDNTLLIDWVARDNEAENPGNCGVSVKPESGQTAASLLITVINNNYQIRRYAVNACSNLNNLNGFNDIVEEGRDNYLSTYRLAVTATDRLVRINPLYNFTSLRVTGVNPLPIQSYLINSSAQVATGETKALEVSRLEPALPVIFDYVLFSGGDLLK